MPVPEPLRVGQLHYATDGRDILENSPDGWEVDRQYLWWDGPAGGDGTGGPFGNPPPDARDFGPTLAGLSIPAVTRCEELISRPISTMPWKTYRGREQLTTPTWISDPQNLALDGRRTDIGGLPLRLSNVEFWSQAVRSYLSLGEAIIWTPRLRDEAGEPTGEIVAPIYLIHPKHVTVDEGRYLVQSDEDESGFEEIDARELLVVRNIVRPGYQRGIGIIEAHAADLVLAAKIRGYVDNMFQRGIPHGYLTSDKPDLKPEDAADLKRSWLKNNGGIKKSIAVLNATTHFEPLNLDPATVQIVEMLRLQAWQVALMYGIPPSKLGINVGASNTYANLESDNAVYVQDALMPVARKFEAAIDAILPAGTSVKIDFRQLLRGDTKTRYETYSIGLTAGFLTREEVREWEDLPELADPTPDPALTQQE